MQYKHAGQSGGAGRRSWWRNTKSRSSRTATHVIAKRQYRLPILGQGPRLDIAALRERLAQEGAAVLAGAGGAGRDAGSSRTSWRTSFRRTDPTGANPLDRRNLLKLMGASLGLAGLDGLHAAAAGKDRSVRQAAGEIRPGQAAVLRHCARRSGGYATGIAGGEPSGAADEGRRQSRPSRQAWARPISRRRRDADDVRSRPLAGGVARRRDQQHARLLGGADCSCASSTSSARAAGLCGS